MNEIQKTALDKSINEKWVQIVAGKLANFGYRDCACCDGFNTRANGYNCSGCPIMEYTGKRYCEGTPYEAYHELDRKMHRLVCCDSPEAYDLMFDLKAAAQWELDFLREVRGAA